MADPIDQSPAQPPRQPPSRRPRQSHGRDSHRPPHQQSGWSAWHPPQPVLELTELVLDGALSDLPERVRAKLPVQPGRGPGGGGRLIEDAEGVPVAVISQDGSLASMRPFTHPPLRSHRHSADQVRSLLSGEPTEAVVVRGPAGREAVEALAGSFAGPGTRRLWLVLIGADRDLPMPAEALYRATRTLAAEFAGPNSPLVVPLVLPSGYDDLIEEIARAYGATSVRELPVSPALDLHPAFAGEMRARQAARGAVVFFTGLSGSGKSTIAKGLLERILDHGGRTVSMLDGDEVRRMLSSGLGFSAEDRATNIARIGFVAAEIARHGGLAIAAPIAPFEVGRAEVRRRVNQAGAEFLLIHVATTLEECERRDRKGLYAKARRGEIPEFTGISSAYEEPQDADLVLDTVGHSVAEGVEAVWRLMIERGLLPESD